MVREHVSLEEFQELKSELQELKSVFNSGSMMGRQLPLINLGTEYTAELKQDISSGTFKKAVVGGMLTINGHIYYFAHPDYWYRSGDTVCQTHHMVVVPARHLAVGQMNSTRTTEGGYVGSDFRTGSNGNTALSEVKNIIKTDFGEENILTHREMFTNAVSQGYPSAVEWFDSDIDLMSEYMVYGHPAWQPMGDGTTIPNKHTVDKTQLKLFQERPDLISTRGGWWLRDVVRNDFFACVGPASISDRYYADSSSFGIRPAFAIC